MNEYTLHCPVCQFMFEGSEDDPAKPTYCPNGRYRTDGTPMPASRPTFLIEGPRVRPFLRGAHETVAHALGETTSTGDLGPVAELVNQRTS